MFPLPIPINEFEHSALQCNDTETTHTSAHMAFHVSFFPTYSLFFTLIHTCTPASAVCNSLVNNKKALIVLPRDRSVSPPTGREAPAASDVASPHN